MRTFLVLLMVIGMGNYVGCFLRAQHFQAGVIAGLLAIAVAIVVAGEPKKW